MKEREKLGSRLGFIILSASCAIGLGNIWRFPFFAGMFGGGIFVFFFTLFVFAIGVPILSMEFSIGRASGKSIVKAFEVLQPKGSHWKIAGYAGILGNYALMMFYLMVTGWMFAYIYRAITGEFMGLEPDAIISVFTTMQANAVENIIWTFIVCAIGFGVCAIGLQKGVERVNKLMMMGLMTLLLLLVLRSLTLPGAVEGVRFLFVPNPAAIEQFGIWRIMYEALGSAFFSISVGMGAMLIFGSYISKEKRLMGESMLVAGLDILICFLAGLMIFPAVFAYGLDPASGPGLIFITLPNVFNAMPAGRLWAIVFFFFMSVAATTTVIAVLENLVANTMDVLGCSRKKACLGNMIALPILSLPAILGWSYWSHINPLGPGTNIQSLLDFIVSNNVLPLGSLIFLLFCMSKRGWGYAHFMSEVNTGDGLRFPTNFTFYFAYVVPVLLIAVFIMGYLQRFGLV